MDEGPDRIGTCGRKRYVLDVNGYNEYHTLGTSSLATTVLSRMARVASMVVSATVRLES
jgi:hypothetical protein